MPLKLKCSELNSWKNSLYQRVKRLAGRGRQLSNFGANVVGRDSVASDIHFYCSSPFDHIFISSTLHRCINQGMRVALSVSDLDGASYASLRARYKNRIWLGEHSRIHRNLNTRVLVTPSSSVTRKQAKIQGSTTFIHMPHSIASLHAIYPSDAFDEYDFLFAVGPHHVNEYAKIKERRLLFGTTISVGYGKFDALNEEYTQHTFLPKINEAPRVLIAPSWNEKSFLDSIGPELISALTNRGINVTLRPHPLQMQQKDLLSTFRRIELMNSHFAIENPFKVDNHEIFFADILIGDFSGISFEFAILRNRPVISIDGPPKILNKNWRSINIEPIEISMRTRLGSLVNSDIDEILMEVDSILGENKLEDFPNQNMQLVFPGSPMVSDNAWNQIRNFLE